jgi:hypothetical protein
LIFYFYRNTPMLASGIKGICIHLRMYQLDLNPFSCGSALDAPQLAARVRCRRFTPGEAKLISGMNV